MVAIATGVVVLLAASSPASAEAVPLLPAAAPVDVPPLSADAEPTRGAVIHDEFAPFTLTNRAGDVLCEGTLQNRVVQSEDGHLEFHYRVGDASGPGTIGTITASGFGGHAVHVAYQADEPAALPPSQASRSLGLGETVTFTFRPALSCSAGEMSAFMVVQTAATTFQPGGTVRLTDVGVLGVWVPTARP